MRAFTRRAAILAAIAAAAPLRTQAEEDPITLWWTDLLPEDGDEGSFFQDMKDLGIVQHGELSNLWEPQPPAKMVTKYNDKQVRIPGFMLPVEYSGWDVMSGLLVPYVGACIHVPPPPANQLVFVQMAKPADDADLWDPVWAIGAFSAAAVETEFAEVGYHMTEARVERYEA